MQVQNIQTNCDSCNRILRGQDRKDWIDEEHIAIKGTISMQTHDSEGNQDHYFITRSPNEFHHFCNMECLTNYAEMRKKQHEQRRERLLRNEANLYEATNAHYNSRF